MRIAFFVHRFPSVSETFVLRQVTDLIDLGHEVDVYSERTPEENHPVHEEFNEYRLREHTVYLDVEMPVASGYWSMPVWPFTDETWLPGIEHPISNSDRLLHAVPVLQDCLEKSPGLAVQVLDPQYYGFQATSLEALYHLHSLMHRRGGYDVLHAHFGPVGVQYRFARALWNAPFIVTFHGHDFSAIPRREGAEVYRRLFSEVDLITTVSNYAVCRITELGCPPEKVTRLHVGIDLDKHKFRPRTWEPGAPVMLLTIGRLVEKKGTEYLLRAIAILLDRNCNVHCEVIGDGPLRKALDELSASLGITEHVSFLGSANTTTIHKSLDRAHLFVLPSVTGADGDQEGVPVSLMEAQAAGLPVISTWHSGIPELVRDGQSGMLVPERDPQAIADRLQYLMEHHEMWPEMGHQGRRIVEEQFNTDLLNRDLVRLYELAVGNYRTSQHASTSSAAQ